MPHDVTGDRLVETCCSTDCEWGMDCSVGTVIGKSSGVYMLSNAFFFIKMYCMTYFN